MAGLTSVLKADLEATPSQGPHTLGPTRSPLLRVRGQDTFLERGRRGGAARPSLAVESAGVRSGGQVQRTGIAEMLPPQLLRPSRGQELSLGLRRGEFWSDLSYEVL